jgi:8-oxo-dGTP diphosphatase
VAVLRDGKVLVVRRAADDYLGGVYELPGGGVDPGETIAESAVREVLEETGLKVRRIVGLSEGFDYQTPVKPKVRQINVIVEAEPGEVVLDPSEHDAYRWIDRQDIADLPATGAMRDSLERLFASLDNNG